MSNQIDEFDLVANITRDSFFQFFLEFWDEIIKEKLELNWHIKYICDTFQKAAERVFANQPKDYDIIYNVPPGTSKSTILSIMAPAWILTRMPSARIICVSHTSELVLDLSRKCRDVVNSDKYQKCFGVERNYKGKLIKPVIISDDQNAKGYWATSEGGMRLCSTIGGRVPTGFHAHFLLCFPYDTAITTSMGRISIGRIVEEKLPVKVLAYDHKLGKEVWRSIKKYYKNPGQPLLKIKLSNGTELKATDCHPIFVKGKGYTVANELKVGDQLYVRQRKNEDDGLCLLQKGIQKKPQLQKGKALLQQPMLASLSEVLFERADYGYCEMQWLWKQSKEKHKGSKRKQNRSILQPVVQRQMGCQTSTRNQPSSVPSKNSSLRNMRQGDGTETLRDKSILQQGLLRSMVIGTFERGEPSCLGREKEEELRSVREDNASSSREQKKVLRKSMPKQGNKRREQLAMEGRVLQEEKLRLVRQRDGSLCRQEQGQDVILFEGLCKQSSLGKNIWNRQLELYSRQRPCPLSSGIQQETQGRDSEKGKASLFQMQEVRRGNRKEIGSSSHRLGQRELQEVESCCFVSRLSWQYGRKEKEKIGRGEVFVIGIEREVRVPRSVYNIEVEIDNNYFAKDVLVHNCDDPINPKEVISEIRMKEANRWMREVLPSRKVNKLVSLSVLLMQRLAQHDPTGDRIENKRAGKIKHISLPAEADGTEIKPSYLKKFYVDGLLDPIRMPEQVLEEYRGDQYAYASQFLQSPVPLSGGLFQWKELNYGVPPTMDKFKRLVRYWDTAGSMKDTACYTAGVLMGVTYDNNYWVLDVVRDRYASHKREAVILRTAQLDGKRVKIGIEQQGGSSGMEVVRSTVKMLAGFNAWADKPTGDKATRAVPFSVQVNNGNVWLPNYDDLKYFWVKDFVEELKFFPASRYKDQCDASSGAFNELVRKRVVGGVDMGTPGRLQERRAVTMGLDLDY